MIYKLKTPRRMCNQIPLYYPQNLQKKILRHNIRNGLVRQGLSAGTRVQPEATQLLLENFSGAQVQQENWRNMI